MTESIAQNNIDAYAEFEKWLGEQPYWLQDATYRIYHGFAIDEAQISSYADMCIMQIRKEKPVHETLAQNESSRQMGYSHMAVVRLFDIFGVNALASDASLDFSTEGVTVVYGLNGAGKSGFMRIFKQLSGSPYEEIIHPNVYKKGAAEKPTCKFIIKEDSSEQEISCNLSSNSKETPLASCDVFDTRISNDYITKNNHVSYQPLVFSVLAELASIAGRITRHINSRMDAIPSPNIFIPKDLENRTEVKWIQKLDESTVFPAQYTSWTTDQQKATEEIPKRLDTERVNSDLRLYRSQIATVRSILDDLMTADSAIRSPELIAAHNALVEAKKKYDAAELLFKETADDYDKNSVSISHWKELWQIAQRYYETSVCKDGVAHFGEPGTICPLCHQVLVEPTITRFRSVNEYVNGTCSEDFNKADRKLKDLLTAIATREFSASQIKKLLSGIFKEEEVAIIKEAYELIGGITIIGDTEAKYARLSTISVSEAIKVLSSKKDSLKNEIEALEQALQDEGRALLQEQLSGLTCHKWIYDNKVSIEDAIKNIIVKKELTATKSLLTTNRITAESNRLASRLITDAYIERFARELQRLAPSIKVKLEKAPSQKGSTPYRVTIDTDSGIKCNPEDILSEGEQRIVALAAFFADATGREALTPIIIDDPISSLDLNYESAATRRIVELARSRQVIVFTHRISMLTGIEEICKSLDVQHKENYIRSTLRGKGVPDLSDIYRGSVKKHLSGIQSRLSEIKMKDPDSSEFIDAVGRQCQQFRICIERSVEDVLLLGILHRFERRIMTKDKVNRLTKITDEDCKLVDDMMTKYSFTEHSQPVDSPPVGISIDELNADISAFIQWIGDYNKRV